MSSPGSCSGELPSHRVFEDEVALAFMDVMPRVEGHVLVIPKRPVRTLFDIAAADLAALMPRVQRVGLAAASRLSMPKGLDAASVQRGGRRSGRLPPACPPPPPATRHGPLRAPGGPMEKPEVLAATGGTYTGRAGLTVRDYTRVPPPTRRLTSARTTGRSSSAKNGFCLQPGASCAMRDAASE